MPSSPACTARGLSTSRIGCAHLVISAILAEAVRDKKLAVIARQLLR